MTVSLAAYRRSCMACLLTMAWSKVTGSSLGGVEGRFGAFVRGGGVGRVVGVCPGAFDVVKGDRALVPGTLGDEGDGAEVLDGAAGEALAYGGPGGGFGDGPAVPAGVVDDGGGGEVVQGAVV